MITNNNYNNENAIRLRTIDELLSGNINVTAKMTTDVADMKAGEEVYNEDGFHMMDLSEIQKWVARVMLANHIEQDSAMGGYKILPNGNVEIEVKLVAPFVEHTIKGVLTPIHSGLCPGLRKYSS